MSSLAGYLQAPIVTDARSLMQKAFVYIQAQNPGWLPSETELDTWIIEAYGLEAADIATLASAVPKGVFRFVGSKLFNINPIDASPAQCTSTWYLTDSIGHKINAGTQVGIRDSAGVLQPFRVLADVIVPSGASQTDDDAVVLIAVTPGTAGSSLGGTLGVVNLIDAIPWVDHVEQTAVTSGGVDAESDDVYMDRVAVQLQTMSPRPILAPDFAILARNIASVQRAVAIDNYNPHHNLLSVNDASLETSVGNWINNSNAVVTRDATFGIDGTCSLKMLSVAAGTMIADIAPAAAPAVAPGDVVTCVATFKPVSARTCLVEIAFFDAARAFITTAFNAGTAVGAGVATQVSITAVAPALAAYACPVVQVNATAGASEKVNVDKISLRRGTGTDWVPGGTPRTGNERMVTVMAVETDGEAVGSGTRTAIEAYLEALREQSFVVNTDDPQFTLVDVTAHISLMSGYVESDVLTRLSSAITAFLSPSTWGISPNDNPNNPVTWINKPTVYYLEMATMINNIAGVDIVNLLTLGPHGGSQASADMTLGGIVPLPTAGTIAVAVG